MKRIFAFSLVFALASNAYGADVLDLNTALQNTYRACAEIDDNLHDLKVLAGVNTAVTGVGTGLGVGAAATGFVKASTDNRIEELEKELERLSAEYDGPEPTKAEKDAFLRECEEYERLNPKNIETEISQLTEKSKKLGNWRTGLLAGNTATSIAGAVIASQTINKDDIQGQIEACISANKDLSNAIMQARLNGEDVSEAQSIYEACRPYEHVDISPINKRGKGAMIAASIGAGIGGIGTITSGVANSDKIRDDNSEAGKKTKKYHVF